MQVFLLLLLTWSSSSSNPAIDICGVCHEEMELVQSPSVTKFNCGHFTHRKCMTDWLDFRFRQSPHIRPNCLKCNRILQVEDLHDLAIDPDRYSRNTQFRSFPLRAFLVQRRVPEEPNPPVRFALRLVRDPTFRRSMLFGITIFHLIELRNTDWSAFTAGGMVDHFQKWPMSALYPLVLKTLDSGLMLVFCVPRELGRLDELVLGANVCYVGLCVCASAVSLMTPFLGVMWMLNILVPTFQHGTRFLLGILVLIQMVALQG